MDSLIADLEQGIAQGSDYVKVIKYPCYLLTALREFNEMIGNDQTKDDVAAQVVHLIANKHQGNNEPLMLHSLLYGSAGTGKTTIGTHLARIWYALGYISGSKKSNVKGVKSSTQDRVKEDADITDLSSLFDMINSDNLDDLQTGYVKLTILITILTIVGLIFTYIWSTMRALYSAMGLIYFSILLGIGILIVILMAYWFIGSYNAEIERQERGHKVPDREEVKKDTKEQKIRDVSKCENISDNDIISVVSREDFIGQYVGWTEKKTKELLARNRGKVLFIDEAYSLVSDGHGQDSYGREALNILNRWMSERPDEIVIIMAGYQDKIENGLFRSQPGLVRRFMWTFDCSGYNIDELFEIFKQQLGSKWKLKNPLSARKLFHEHADSFPNFAGDTLKLVNYVTIQHSRDVIGNRECEKGVLNNDQVKRGLQMLVRNTFTSNPSKTDNLHEDWMSRIMSSINPDNSKPERAF
jgi:DNA polymerase III delta prime subunit